MKYKHYIRVTRSLFDREFIVGVQFFDNDDVTELRRDVKFFMDTVMHDFSQSPLMSDDEYAEIVHEAAKILYPGREHFLEIGDDKNSWVQICPPEEIYVTN